MGKKTNDLSVVLRRIKRGSESKSAAEIIMNLTKGRNEVRKKALELLEGAQGK